MTKTHIELKKKQSYPVMDTFRFFLAIIGVISHTSILLYFFPDSWIQPLDYMLLHPVVPFFFVSSGFFLFCKFLRSEKDGEYNFTILTSCIKKYLVFYLSWNIVYLPIVLYVTHISTSSLKEAVWLLIRGYLFTGENFYSVILWFIIASIVGLTLVFLFLKLKFSPTATFIISILLALVGRGIDMLRACENLPEFISAPVNAYYFIFSNTRNGFFYGMVYIALGMFFAQICIKGIDISLPLLVALFVVSNVLCFFTSYGIELKGMYEPIPYFFCNLFRVGVMFMMCLCFPKDPKPFHAVLREESKVIYFVHMFYYAVFIFGVSKFWKPGKPVIFLIVLVLSFLTGLLVVHCKKHKKFKIINYLF